MAISDDDKKKLFDLVDQGHKFTTAMETLGLKASVPYIRRLYSQERIMPDFGQLIYDLVANGKTFKEAGSLYNKRPHAAWDAARAYAMQANKLWPIK